MICKLFKMVVMGSFTASAAMAADCVEGVDEKVRVVEGGVAYQAQLVGAYTAAIAARDLTNSKGVQLSSFAAVLQQDRANVHKTGMVDHFGDFHDEVDAYFTSPKRRSQLAGAKYFTACYMSASDTKALKADIVNGQVLGVVWVVSFRRPDGGLGVYLSQVN